MVFLICGVVTVLIGRVYGGLRLYTPLQLFVWSPFFYSFLMVGIIAVCLSFAPASWTESTIGNPGGLKRSIPFRFLLTFAAIGLLVAVAVSFLPPSFARPSIPVVYSLCPACVLTVTVDPSLAVSLFVLAPINALIFGAVGGVIGTGFTILNR